MRMKLVLGSLALMIAAQAVTAVVWLRPWETQTLSVAVFNAEAALNRFVRWSSSNIPDDQFAAALPMFQEAVAEEINRFSKENSIVIVRPGAVLTQLQSPPTDVTEFVMERVLADAAF